MELVFQFPVDRIMVFVLTFRYVDLSWNEQ